MAIPLKHLCALHYTLTRLSRKRAGMDKSILAHQFVHFLLTEQMKGRYFCLGSGTEGPGLSGLVYLSDAIGGSIRGMENRKGISGTDSRIHLGGPADELARLARHVHHTGQLLRQKPVHQLQEFRSSLYIGLQGTCEKLLRNGLFDQGALGGDPASAPWQLAFQVRHNAFVRACDKTDQLVGCSNLPRYNARPLAACTFDPPLIVQQVIRLMRLRNHS